MFAASVLAVATAGLVPASMSRAAVVPAFETRARRVLASAAENTKDQAVTDSLRQELEAANSRINDLTAAAQVGAAATAVVVANEANAVLNMNSAPSPVLVVSALAFSAIGAVLLGGGEDKTPPTPAKPKARPVRKPKAKPMSMREKRLLQAKVAELKREGEAAVARREAINKAARIGIVTPVDAIFDRMDKDGDGSVDRAELKEALDAAGRASDEEAVSATMKAMDTDNDGVISRKEFKRAAFATTSGSAGSWWERDDSR